MSRPTKVIIDLLALRHNLQVVRQMAPACSVLAMVKSNAYGHGLERIAQALSDVDAFGVACLEEGLQLRNVGVMAPIVLMEGLFTAEELPLAVMYDFTLVIHHQAQIDILEKNTDIKKPLQVWLKINTGMNRLGFEPCAVEAAYQQLMNCRLVAKPIGLMTHFAEADALEKSTTLQQINTFHSITAHLPGPRSLANSAGIMAWPSAHAEWIRPGIMLYGVSPFTDRQGSEYNLKPVMTLSSKLIATHFVAKNSQVGYGGRWVCPEDMRIGVVAIGYGDGYPCHAKNGAPVLVNGQHCPLVGRVAMDMLTVDLRSQPEAIVGDPVLLWGSGLPVEVIAKHSGTSAYELLTRITQRVSIEIA